MSRPVLILGMVLSCGALCMGQAPDFKPPATVKPSEAELSTIHSKIETLANKLMLLAGKISDDDHANVAVFHKAAVWIEKHGEFYTAKDAGMTIKVLDEGIARAEALSGGERPWKTESGASARGYRSKIDGSIQPCFVVIPADLDRNAATRLDVVLHGRGANLHEVRFLHDRAKTANSAKAPGLILHVFGRTNNAYRWAGETDVFEAIEAVKHEFRVDVNRILLRGFSMGGAGAWHLGLHHPSVWAAVDAGAGFSETEKYAKQTQLPAWRKQLLRIYDAKDYALNAFNVPMAGYGGEIDPQLQASENIVAALKSLGVTFKVDNLVTTAEGLDFRRIVGKGMGHKVDAASEGLLKTFRDEHAAKGVDRLLAKIRFVTYTPRYGRAQWFTVEGMMELYQRATVEGELTDGLARLKTENINLLSVDRAVAEKVEIDGQQFPLREAVKGLLPGVYFQKTEKGWTLLDYDQSRAVQENVRRQKRAGLQGPIDDAFLGPILVVEPSGKAWNPKAAEWSDRRLQTFERDWDKWLRGSVPSKLDTEITPEDIENHHLLVFGDPGSNQILARVLKELPISWTETEITLKNKYDAASHVPVLITVNPLNPRKYLVINTGHTLRAADFSGTNALLFPRLGDFAVFSVGKPDEPVISGFFDNHWKIPE